MGKTVDLWVTRDGDEIPVTDMKDLHIISALHKVNSIVEDMEIREDLDVPYVADRFLDWEHRKHILLKEAKRRKLSLD